MTCHSDRGEHVKNIDKIRNMTTEEMALFLSNIATSCAMNSECVGCPLEGAEDCGEEALRVWLEEEYIEGEFV